MNKVRLIENGFKAFTGNMGGVEYLDGESTEALSRHQIEAIAAVMRVEVLGEYKTAAQRQVDRSTAATEQEAALRQSEEEKLAEQRRIEAQNELAKITAKTDFDRAALEQIADEKGIAGLRELAAPLGVKGRAVAELIEEILKKQAAIEIERKALEERAGA